MRFISLVVVFILIMSLASCDSNENSILMQDQGEISSTFTENTSKNMKTDSTPTVNTHITDTSIPSKTTEKSSPSSKVTTITKATTTEATTKVSKSTVKVTIPEGFSLAQIAELMEQKGICSKDELIKTSNSYDFSYYSLVSLIPNNVNRCFKLEGYLFADTYEFYLNEKPENVIGKLLRNTESKINDEIRKSSSSIGYSIDEVLTIASIIEKEAGKVSEMKKISSVIHNRINIERKLECDVTINYVERYIKPYISGDKNRYNEYYNTYKCDALPAGPICNPSLNAIRAAISPGSSNYLFFVSDKSGNYYYASNGIEHKENVIKAGLEWIE